MTPRLSTSAPSRWLHKRWSWGPPLVLAATLLATGVAAAPSSAAAATATAKSTVIQANECNPDNTFVHYAGSRRGRFKCGTEIYPYRWPIENGGQFPYDGRLEEFGVGGDGIVYHAWQRYPGDEDWEGWWSLGGHDVFWGVQGMLSGETGISVVGSDHLTYCKHWQWWRNDWSYWYQCFG